RRVWESRELGDRPAEEIERIVDAFGPVSAGSRASYMQPGFTRTLHVSEPDPAGLDRPTDRIGRRRGPSGSGRGGIWSWSRAPPPRADRRRDGLGRINPVESKNCAILGQVEQVESYLFLPRRSGMPPS